MLITKSKFFKNGCVLALKTSDEMMIETTDTFLPEYTRYCINNTNSLIDGRIGGRHDRWMIGVSCMSGCPCRCKFCATENMKTWRNLTSYEIAEQVFTIIGRNPSYSPKYSKEFKINYTRMGEPFLNIYNVRTAINIIEEVYPNTHHYISTIGIKNSDFSWIEGNISLQISLHSCSEERRNFLIPYKNKMTIEELGQIRTRSKLKTTINLTLVDRSDFSIDILKKYFPKEHFFIKLSPINENRYSRRNNLGPGVIASTNIL